MYDIYELTKDTRVNFNINRKWFCTKEDNLLKEYREVSSIQYGLLHNILTFLNGK